MSDGARLLPTAGEIPANGVLLHVGVHKTGTTALQAALADARPELAALSVTYPGKKQAHHTAALAVVGRTWGWKDNGGEVTPISRYDKLVGQVKASSGKAIVSSEFFCEADAPTAARVVSDLGGDRVKVVITLRNLGKLLPSSWQQYLKYGVSMPYETWLTRIFETAEPGKVTPSFWQRNDHGAVVQRWSDAVGAENVTVMVLEGVDHEANFVAFAQMLGVPGEILVSRMNLTSNRSMTAAEAEFLRQLNAKVRKEMTWDDYLKYVRNGFARVMVEEREPAADEPRLHTPDWALDAAVERGNWAADAIAASGVTVLGDLAGLRARASSPPAHDGPIVVPTDIAVSAAMSMIRTAETPATPKERARGLASRLRRSTRRASSGKKA
jgi:hypothetical protein